jgi:hypothetical protein
MRLSTIRGVIRRRVLLNYRIDPAMARRVLPPVFRPKLHAGHAVGGICLIRLEHIRPSFLPAPLGLTSENAAHRIAVEWDGTQGLREGVYVPRRDSNSRLHQWVGGRLFPGAHHEADFEVRDEGERVDLRMASRDGAVVVELAADAAPRLPASSIFGSLAEASEFFERGSVGYSTTEDPRRYDGLVLDTAQWRVSPLAVRDVRSSYFEDPERFAPGTVVFDHALIMRDVEHRWVAAPDLEVPALVEPAAACP